MAAPFTPPDSRRSGLPIGLTGATAATRYVGATASGAPASGTFAVGDFVIDQSGKVYVCSVAGTSGTWAQVGATYSPPTGRSLISGNDVTINDTQVLALTWDSLDSGSALLNRTSLGAPTVVTAGIYAFTIVIRTSFITAGAFYIATLELDSNGDDATLDVPSPPATAVDTGPKISLAATYYMPAGAIILLKVNNRDGVAARDFSIQAAVVQRIT